LAVTRTCARAITGARTRAVTGGVVTGVGVITTGNIDRCRDDGDGPGALGDVAGGVGRRVDQRVLAEGRGVDLAGDLERRGDVAVTVIRGGDARQRVELAALRDLVLLRERDLRRG